MAQQSGMVEKQGLGIWLTHVFMILGVLVIFGISEYMPRQDKAIVNRIVDRFEFQALKIIFNCIQELQSRHPACIFLYRE